MQQRLDKQSYYFLGDVSDKVKELVKLLSNYKDKPDFHAIVFVEQRHHAQALSMLLSKSQTLQAFIRPEHFVGHGSGGSERLASEGMQAKVVSDIAPASRLCQLSAASSNEEQWNASAKGRRTFSWRQTSRKRVLTSRRAT